jgi:cytochrome c oxidase subunit 4
MGELGHVIEPKVFAKILGTLLFLTVITVLVAPSVSGISFGAWNIVIALFIATIKATLVLMYFMHLKYEDKVTLLYFVFPVFLLFTLIAGIFIDNPFRDRELRHVEVQKGLEIKVADSIKKEEPHH